MKHLAIALVLTAIFAGAVNAQAPSSPLNLASVSNLQALSDDQMIQLAKVLQNSGEAAEYALINQLDSPDEQTQFRAACLLGSMQAIYT